MPYNVEPSVAHSVLTAMVAAEQPRLAVFFEAQVDNVTKAGATITAITTDDGRVFQATTFVDSSYEGDLLARAGVDYTVGRESPAAYNESLNGRLKGDPRNMNNFKAVVDPFDEQGRTLPGIMTAADAAASAGKPGEGDNHIQAYNFRVCMTTNPNNQLPFLKPDEYHPEDYELLARTLTAHGDSLHTAPSCNTAPIPNFKYDNNNCGPVSSDLITADYTNASWRNLTSWAYPEASYATRREIWQVHRRWQQGLFWTLSYDARVPQKVRISVYFSIYFSPQNGPCSASKRSMFRLKTDFLRAGAEHDGRVGAVQGRVHGDRRLATDFVPTPGNAPAVPNPSICP